MCEIFAESVWAAMVLIYVMGLGVGAGSSYSAWQNQIKDVFILSQTQVNLLGSSLIFGTYMGLVSGLLLEHCGIRRTGCAAMSTALAYIALLTTFQFPSSFNEGLFPVLMVLLFIMGLGIVLNHIAIFTVFLQNFSTQYGGRALAVMALSDATCMIIVGSGVLKLRGIIIFMSFLQISASLCSIFLLKRKSDILKKRQNSLVNRTSHNGHYSDETANGNTSDSDVNVAVTNETRGSDFERTNQNEENNFELSNRESADLMANENSHLILSFKEAIYGEITGKELMKNTDYWLLFSTFVIGGAIDRTYQSNTGTFTRSFKVEDHLNSILIVAPIGFVVSKMSVGVFTDYFREKVPRLIILLVFYFFKILMIALFTFIMYKLAMIYIMAVSVNMFIGVYYVAGQILFADYFGSKYFAINYGFAMVAEGISVLLLQFIVGVFYDANVSDVTTHTCYGLRCYNASSGVLFTLSIVAFVTSLILYVRSRKL